MIFLKTLVSAHDAGGAEIVSSWVKTQSNRSLYYYVAGPAKAIFERKIPHFSNETPETILPLLQEIDQLVIGTSGDSDFERSLLHHAKKIGKKTAAFLDHWVHYKRRFQYQDTLLLPDELWVGDPYAEKEARAHFPHCPITLIANPYLEELLSESKKASKDTELRKKEHSARCILYVCEPIPSSCGYDEHFALSHYLTSLSQGTRYTIKIRLHPSERKNKYQETIASFQTQFLITFSENSSLVEDCLWADWVVGCETMAMVVALHLGKNVSSCIPPGGKPCALPFPEISRLF